MEILQIILTSLLPVVVTVTLCLLKKHTRFGQMKYTYSQIIIGVIFGVTASLSTEFGVQTELAIINVRDASPMCAAFIFGGPAGIISAVIGSAERLFSGFALQNGEYSAIACAVSTLAAGVFAVLFNKLFNKKERPSYLFVLIYAIAIESFHMLMVFATHVSDIYEAYLVVRDCVFIMIIANAAAVLISLFFSSLIFNDYNVKQQSITNVLEKWFVLAVAVTFAIRIFIVFFAYTLLATNQTESILSSSLWGFTNSVKIHVDSQTENNFFIATELTSIPYTSSDGGEIKYTPYFSNVTEEDILNVTERDKLDSDTINLFLRRFAEETNIPCLEILSEDYKVLYSGDSTHIGKTADRKDIIIDYENEFYYHYEKGYFNKSGYTITIGKSYNQEDNLIWSNYGKYVQCVFNEDYIMSQAEVCMTARENKYDIQETGTIKVLSEYEGGFIDLTSILNAETENLIDYFSPEEMEEMKLTRLKIDGIDKFLMYQKLGNNYILAEISVDEVMTSRNVTLMIITLLEVVAFSILFIVINLFVKRTIIKDVEDISDKLSQISSGNLDVGVNVRTSREFSALSDDINTTVNTMKSLIKAETERNAKELALAKAIQRSALPGIFPPYPDKTEFDIYALMEPAKEVGGDFYDFFMIDDNTLAFTVADVSGKGIPGALFMMQTKTMLENLARQGSAPDELFTVANERLCEANSAEMFVTVWMGIIDLKTGHVKYVNAGHNPPIIIRGDKVEYLKARTGFVLAGLHGIKYKYQELTLEKGDKIVLYTDGITEAMNVDEQFFGESRLLDVVDRGKTLRVEGLCNVVRSELDDFVGDAEQFDDITILALRYNGHKDGE